MAFSICVFCGSRHGADPRFRAAATRFGELAGAAGLRLIYGGGHVGLMGAVADAAMAAGAAVVGFIPTGLLAREVGHRAITELIVTSTMYQRKQEMIDRADAFVILPGGLGTWTSCSRWSPFASLGITTSRSSWSTWADTGIRCSPWSTG